MEELWLPMVYGIRPVVKLKSSVTLKENETGIWEININAIKE